MCSFFADLVVVVFCGKTDTFTDYVCFCLLLSILLRKVGEHLREALANFCVLLEVLLQLRAAHRAGEALKANLALNGVLALLVLLHVLGSVLDAGALRLLHLALTALVGTTSISRRHFVSLLAEYARRKS